MNAVSDDALLDASIRDATELRLTTALRAALEQKAAFELEVLNSRDYAAAQAAIIGDLRYRLESSVQIHQLHDKNHREHIARLETALREASREASKAANQAEGLRRQIAAMRDSSTWRLGRVIMLPVRVVKRLTRRG
mgnify:CR=1 FL=1